MGFNAGNSPRIVRERPGTKAEKGAVAPCAGMPGRGSARECPDPTDPEG